MYCTDFTMDTIACNFKRLYGYTLTDTDKVYLINKTWVFINKAVFNHSVIRNPCHTNKLMVDCFYLMILIPRILQPVITMLGTRLRYEPKDHHLEE